MWKQTPAPPRPAGGSANACRVAYIAPPTPYSVHPVETLTVWMKLQGQVRRRKPRRISVSNRRGTVTVPGGGDRPYFKLSIAQLEALFDQAQADLIALRALEYELGYRTTDRATKLRSRVAGLVATLSIRQVSAAGGGESRIGPLASPGAVVVAFPKIPIREQLSPTAQKQEEAG